jgi:hypothetical protein
MGCTQVTTPGEWRGGEGGRWGEGGTGEGEGMGVNRGEWAGEVQGTGGGVLGC